MRLYKGYSPKYSSGYLFYLAPENIQFIDNHGIGYWGRGKYTVIRKVNLNRTADSLTPIGIPNEASQSNT